jgi:hypothetical protein
MNTQTAREIELRFREVRFRPVSVWRFFDAVHEQLGKIMGQEADRIIKKSMKRPDG